MAEKYKCIYRLDNKWNKDKCRCEYKELIDKGVCNNGMLRIQVIVNVSVIKHVMLVNI